MAVRYDYFYGAQQKRYLEQMIRAFSGFQWQSGWRGTSPPMLHVVPCHMASTNRLVTTIMNNNSQLTLNTVPLIAVYQTGLAFAQDRLLHPGHVSELNVVEREFDNTTMTYTGKRGNSYSVKRMMPRPFDMTVNVDLWTSNMEQKYQLEEQMAVIVAPGFDIQNSDNPMDWSALSLATLQDIQHSSRAIPIGTEDEIDIMTMTFKIEMWLTPPAMVTQQSIIEQIITNIYDGEIVDEEPEGNRLAQHATTITNAGISVDRGIITLLGPKNGHLDENGDPYSWNDLFVKMGKVIRPGVSKLLLRTSIDEPQGEVYGTITPDPSAPNELIWQPDINTLPSNTLQPIDAVINPLTASPGINLPAAVLGQRYLLLEDIGISSSWNLIAPALRNDVIEFDGSNWIKPFVSAQHSATERLLNLNTMSQLLWTGEQWQLAVGGVYSAGYWRLIF